MFHIVHAEQFLEAHAADTGHSVQTGKGQGGNAHGHKDGGGIHGHAEHLKESGHAVAEHLERGAGGGGAVRSSGSAGHAKGQHGQQAFQHHGAVTDLEHILFILHGLGGGAGRNQAVEAGHRTAGHGDEEDGEQAAADEAAVFALDDVPGGESVQIHGGMSHQQTHGRTGDHEDEHEGGHVVTGLFKQPHGQHRREEDVHEGDVDPALFGQDDGAVGADDEGQHDKNDAQHRFLPAAEVEFFLDQAKHHGEHHEHDGNHARSAVGGGGSGQRGHAVHGGIGVEGVGHHVGKGSDDQQGEQPAEQQEQAAAQFADVFFNQHTHGFAVILHAGIQRAEVGHGAEEDAAQQHPQQHRQPAESGGLDGAGNGARTRNGGKLVAEHSPAVGRYVVFAIFQPHSRSFGIGVNAPALGDPAAIPGVRTYQADCCDQDDHKRIHDFAPSFHIIDLQSLASLL